VSYSFDVRTIKYGEGIIEVEYCNGEAECYLPEAREFIPCDYQKSSTALMILVPRDVVGTPAGWIVSVDADDYRGQEWNET